MTTEQLEKRGGTERLAEELHKFYRAAFKALASPPGYFLRTTEHPKGHDHGWSNCHKKKYFLRRAEMILKSEEVKQDARVYAWKVYFEK